MYENFKEFLNFEEKSNECQCGCEFCKKEDCANCTCENCKCKNCKCSKD
jgi:hypothetical protein